MPEHYSQQARRRLAADLRGVCMRVSRRARFENTDELAPHQFSVLAQLEKGTRRPVDLARAESVSAPSMSRTLAGLTGAGLVERQDDPQDGRSALLSLTPQGRDALRRVRRSRDAWMSERIADLPDADLATLDAARAILAEVVAR